MRLFIVRIKNMETLMPFPCKQCGRSEDTHTQEESIATTTVEPQQIDQSNGVREAQLADPELGPLLGGKQHAKKPHMEEMKGMSRSSNRLAQIWDQVVVRNGMLSGNSYHLLAPELSYSKWCLEFYARKCYPVFMQELWVGILEWTKHSPV